MLSNELKMAGMLILEEVYTNVKKYGYEREDQEAYLLVFFVQEEDSNVLAFLDYGKKFDPTSFVLEEPDGIF
jgi:anti-sigma regulatory factor (Ser/Thr protein kinase)